jgi:hypothetical protein
MTDQGLLSLLNGCANLNKLSLADTLGITDRGIIEAAPLMANIQALNLSGNFLITLRI